MTKYEKQYLIKEKGGLYENDYYKSGSDSRPPPFLTSGIRFKGFTLAEVLITLGIIGVVAALTIPTLVSNYKQRAWDTAATVFERKLEESLKAMNTQQTLAGYRNTADFVNELAKHFKISKICKNNDLMSCFEDKVVWGAGEAEPEEVDMTKIKTAKNFGQDDWDTDIIGVQLANGTTGLIAYNPDCKQDPYSNQINGTSCLAMLYDTDGFKNPNTSGKDLRSINVSKLGSVCAFELGGTCFGTPFAPTPLTVAECEAEKNKLGIDYCLSDYNYWAGAVQQCGGIDKMASMAQLAEIANYVYNTTNIDAGTQITYLTLDYDRVAELGFSINETGTSLFTIWSRETKFGITGGYRIYGRVFFKDNTGIYYNRTNGSSNDVQAVCIIQ